PIGIANSKLALLLLFLYYYYANPIIKESFAKQLLRTKRQKPGHPDEPMREHMLHMQRLEQRARETSMEHWMNPHCFPRCDRNYGYPV
uniref:Si:dkey-31g6.6 n=1 Tax=Sinocyclocheilus rhinocerous TaxID=307959 RepID=A0A673K296_9TELE